MKVVPAIVVPSIAVVALLPLANLGVWVQREVAGSASFVHLADRVLEEPSVQAEVGERIVSELVSEVPALAGSESSLRPVVARVLTSARVRNALAQSLAVTHGQFRDDRDPLQLDLNPVLPIVRQQLPAALAMEIPPDAKIDPVVVFRRRDAPVVWAGVELVEGVALPLPLFTVGVLVFALLVARRRGRLCVVLGVATTVVALSLIALVEPGRSLLEHEAGDEVRRATLRAGYDTAVHTLVVQTLVVAIAGAVLALVGILVVRRRESTRAASSRARTPYETGRAIP